MLLYLLHPKVASIDCATCQKYQYDIETGKFDEWPKDSGQLRLRVGKPACEYSKDACPKGSPTSGRQLSPRNERAYQHYRECRATNSFPDDPIVRRNAGVIREVEDMVEKLRHDRLEMMLRVALKLR